MYEFPHFQYDYCELMFMLSICYGKLLSSRLTIYSCKSITSLFLHWQMHAGQLYYQERSKILILMNVCFSIPYSLGSSVDTDNPLLPNAAQQDMEV